MLRNILKTVVLGISRKPSCFKRNLKLVKKAPLYTISSHVPTFLCLALVKFVPTVKAEPLLGDSSASTEKKKEYSKAHLDSLINQSDELFSIGKFEESFKVLEPLKDSDNVEILWRISRALFNMSKQKDISKSQNATLIREAFGYIERALHLNDKHYAVHKWMAILVDAKSSLDGIKSRINTLPVFKEHLMIAVELNPKDATSVYMLGQYMYNIADMSWLQLTIAKTLFGTPPEATFEEALNYFSKAEEIEPNFYRQDVRFDKNPLRTLSEKLLEIGKGANLLMLGKTHLKLKRIEAARYWLKCAVAYPVRTDEDEAVRLEAEELLKKHPSTKKESTNGVEQNIQ